MTTGLLLKHPAIAILWMAGLITFNSSCNYIPPAIPSTVIPSGQEKELSAEYVGQSFVTLEESYLYIGMFPALKKTPPTVEKVIVVPAGTRFLVKRVEINQGENPATILAAGYAGTSPPSANVFYVDLSIESRVHQNVQLHLAYTSPAFRHDHPDADQTSEEFLAGIHARDPEIVLAERQAEAAEQSNLMKRLAREAILRELDLNEDERRQIEEEAPHFSGSSTWGAKTTTSYRWKLHTGSKVKAYWTPEMSRDEPPLTSMERMR